MTLETCLANMSEHSVKQSELNTVPNLFLIYVEDNTHKIFV